MLLVAQRRRLGKLAASTLWSFARPCVIGYDASAADYLASGVGFSECCRLLVTESARARSYYLS